MVETPLPCQVDSTDGCLKLTEVNVCDFLATSQPGHILHRITIDLQVAPSSRLLASTHSTASPLPRTRQHPWAGSPSNFNLTAISWIFDIADSLTRSSQPIPSRAVHRCRYPLATHNQLQTGRWPTHSPTSWCTRHLVRVSLPTSGRTRSLFQGPTHRLHPWHQGALVP